MRYKKVMMFLAAGLMTVAMSGCGFKEREVQVTPTPVPVATATPTPSPAPTATPAPTPTSAPRLIGTKTANSKMIYMTNNTEKQFRKIFIRESGYEEWGRNLVPTESSIHMAEQVRMYYTPAESTGNTYDMQYVDSTGNTYYIYSVNLGDMERASLKYDADDGSLYLSYMSLSGSGEKDTRGNGYSEEYDDSDYDESSENDWNEQEYYYDTSDDSGSDSDSGDSEQYYYDDSSDTGSDDNGQTDNSSDTSDTDYDGSTIYGENDGDVDDSGDSGDDGIIIYE